MERMSFARVYVEVAADASLPSTVRVRMGSSDVHVDGQEGEKSERLSKAPLEPMLNQPRNLGRDTITLENSNSISSPTGILEAVESSTNVLQGHDNSSLQEAKYSKVGQKGLHHSFSQEDIPAHRPSGLPIPMQTCNSFKVFQLDDENGSTMDVFGAMFSKVYMVSDSDMSAPSPKLADVECEFQSGIKNHSSVPVLSPAKSPFAGPLKPNLESVVDAQMVVLQLDAEAEKSIVCDMDVFDNPMHAAALVEVVQEHRSSSVAFSVNGVSFCDLTPNSITKLSSKYSQYASWAPATGQSYMNDGLLAAVNRGCADTGPTPWKIQIQSTSGSHLCLAGNPTTASDLAKEPGMKYANDHGSFSELQSVVISAFGRDVCKMM
ncbi:hypothetical protein Nepgr_002714 [Nepenthes gracilis]|uniref:Uncharacterized protein n=1 Tax=Nepenthes gracilis TaxID=150966 RepID=A0AAD3RYK2_NEPGR|nr:hypothetical protein Nepgr_002714 [Nepenthes gracilis]